MSGQTTSMRAEKPPSNGKAGRAALVALAFLVYLGFLLYPFGRMDPRLDFAGPALGMPAMAALYLWHGRCSAGPWALAAFCASAMAIAGVAEVASLSTGFPFGRFAYTDRMRTTLFGVPAIVLAAYAIVGYWCWRTAAILAGRNGAGGVLHVGAATVLMVAWSVVADPVRSTVEQSWIWPEGGPLLGVPLSNLGGWTLTSAAIFTAFAVIERRFPGDARGLPRGLGICPLMYGALAFEYLVHPLVPAPDRIVQAGGVAYSSDAIYAAVAVLALLTMVPAATAAAIIAWRGERHTPHRGKAPSLRLSGPGRGFRRCA